MFIAREWELSQLNKLWNQDKFQLFILYGRRRVGKTALLKEFCKDKPAIFFSAGQSNEHINLDKFSQIIYQYYNEENAGANGYVAWNPVFTDLSNTSSHAFDFTGSSTSVVKNEGNGYSVWAPDVVYNKKMGK